MDGRRVDGWREGGRERERGREESNIKDYDTVQWKLGIMTFKITIPNPNSLHVHSFFFIDFLIYIYILITNITRYLI